MDALLADPRHSHLRVADLPNRKPTPFEIIPDDAGRKAVASALDLLDLRKLRMTGQIEAQGPTDWRLTADLGATIVQACAITLAPVTTRIDEKFSRSFIRDFSFPEGAEAEMPDDDTVEAIPDVIDLDQILLEALSLALPPFPRAPDADLGQLTYTEAGKAAMSDDDAKPFAGLGALRDALAAKDDGEA